MASPSPSTPADSTSADSLAVGGLVWQRWRDVWYMARVSPVTGDGDGAAMVRLHVLGESEAADKWLRADSPLLRALDELPSRDVGVGALPNRGDYVQLLVVDRALRRQLGGARDDDDDEAVALVGRVCDVLVQRDASVVAVEYPAVSGDSHGDDWLQRRVHVGNGYVRRIRVVL